ncbi:MAG TPA: hypothetical protein VNN76_09975 [Bacteroidota bacterium]|nr:hypothetical protein [Bacteroidota bacterium]
MKFDEKQTGRLKIVVVPMLATALTPEDSVASLERFRTALTESKQFDVIPEEHMLSILREAKFQELSNCTYSHCLSDLGKIVGADRVAQTLFIRRGRLYTFRLRIIDSKSADILFDETLEHSGDFEGMLSSTIPEMTQKLTETKLESNRSYKWYLIGAAILGFGTAIYFLNKSLGHTTSPGEGGTPPDRE